jgi:hypothetical protein
MALRADNCSFRLEVWFSNDLNKKNESDGFLHSNSLGSFADELIKAFAASAR